MWVSKIMCNIQVMRLTNVVFTLFLRFEEGAATGIASPSLADVPDLWKSSDVAAVLACGSAFMALVCISASEVLSSRREASSTGLISFNFLDPTLPVVVERRVNACDPLACCFESCARRNVVRFCFLEVGSAIELGRYHIYAVEEGGMCYANEHEGSCAGKGVRYCAVDQTSHKR